MTCKTSQLQQLAAIRRQCSWSRYQQIGDFHQGAYECMYVSPYTKGAHNVDSDLLILLQDWASSAELAKPLDDAMVKLGRNPALPTNKNLEALLRRFFGRELQDTFATNLFPFVKSGSISQKIPRNDLVAAAVQFALPQIAIVQPRLVICLGLVTFQALQCALKHPLTPTLSQAIAQPFSWNSATLWCQAHTGGLGRANRNRGRVDRVSSDWAAMSQWYADAVAR